MASESPLELILGKKDGFCTNFSHLARISREHEFYTETSAKIQKKLKNNS